MFYHHRPENSSDKISPAVFAEYVNVAVGFIADIAKSDKPPFKRKIPVGQAAKIRKCWQDLFGGWKIKNTFQEG